MWSASIHDCGGDRSSEAVRTMAGLLHNGVCRLFICTRFLWCNGKFSSGYMINV